VSQKEVVNSMLNDNGFEDGVVVVEGMFLGLSVEDFDEMTAIDHAMSHLNNFREDHNNNSARNLNKIADKLHNTLEDVYGKEDTSSILTSITGQNNHSLRLEAKNKE